MDRVTAKDLAGALGVSKRAIQLRADREGWVYQEQQARGGAVRHYSVSSLPPAAQAALLPEVDPAAVAWAQAQNDRDAELELERARERAAELDRWSRITDPKKRARTRSKEWIVKMLYELRIREGVPLAHVIRDFERRLIAGELVCPPELRELLPHRHGAVSISVGTLTRWENRYSRLGIAGLIDDYGKRAGRSSVSDHPELECAVLGCLAQRPHIWPRGILAYLQAAHPDLPHVPESTLRRFLGGWKAENAQLWARIQNPDGWKNRFQVAFGSQSESVTALNQLWEMDATPADWMLRDGRHSVIVTIDIYSRRMRALVSKTSKASAVGLAFRRAVRDWGVPGALRNDNGKEFVGRLMSEALDGLGIEHIVCLPFASEQKGHVERAIQTLLHGLLELLEGYIGHNVSERQAIRAQQTFAARVMGEEVVDVNLTAAELQQIIDDWIEHIYHRNGHAGLDGKTPFEVAAGWRGKVRRLEHEGALDMLLLETEQVRTVGKKGIQYDGRFYIDNALVEHIGNQVRVRVDPDDLGRILVLTDYGEFVCWAANPELTGISLQEAAVAAKRAQAKLMAEQRKEMMAHKRAIADDLVTPVLEFRKARGASIVAFRENAVGYTTPALDEHQKAFEALTPAPRAPLTEAQEADMRVFEADFRAPPVRARIDTLRGDPEKYAHWELLDAELQAGRSLDDDELRFHGAYRRSAYWRIAREMEDEFRQQGSA